MTKRIIIMHPCVTESENATWVIWKLVTESDNTTWLNLKTGDRIGKCNAAEFENGWPNQKMKVLAELENGLTESENEGQAELENGLAESENQTPN